MLDDLQLQPDPATLRLMYAEEIAHHIALGYSVRAACLEIGIPPSTGRRYLQLRDELFASTHHAEPDLPGDIPF